MATRSLCVLAALAAGACEVASARNTGASMTDYKIAVNASGATALYLGDGGSLVSEHRSWLGAAYRSNASEAPGVLKLLDATGAVKRIVSGWALGGPVGGDMTWVEEFGDEYHYRVVRGEGSKTVLAPPGDFWAVAGSAGATSSPLGVVVLWRPAAGASWRDPYKRHDELWIATIDRRTGAVVKTRELSITLQDDRAHAIAVAGPPAAPILVLAGLPEEKGPGAYKLTGLSLPTLATVWETPLDVTANDSTASGSAIRTWHALALAPLGDSSGWLVAYGGMVHGRSLVVSQTHSISADGKVTPHPTIDLPSLGTLGPIEGAAGVLVSGESSDGFLELDAVYPASDKVDRLADTHSIVSGKKLGDAPDLVPMVAALRGKTIVVATPAGGTKTGADQIDVAGKQTTPVDWHTDARPRVIARQAWLAARAAAK